MVSPKPAGPENTPTDDGESWEWGVSVVGVQGKIETPDNSYQKETKKRAEQHLQHLQQQDVPQQRRHMMQTAQIGGGRAASRASRRSSC
jgi:hypothetical protein